MSRRVPVACACGGTPEVTHYGCWSVVCMSCYDGAPDAGRQLCGFGRTREAAIEDWNELRKDQDAESSEAQS